MSRRIPYARAAAARAWGVARSDFRRPIELVNPSPAREGWDERQTVTYEISPNERAVVVAVPLRRGSRWTVLLLDGHEGAVEKRGAAIGLTAESLRPGSYRRENFAGRTPQTRRGCRRCCWPSWWTGASSPGTSR